MKPSRPAAFCGRFLITNSISFIVLGQLTFLYWVRCGSLFFLGISLFHPSCQIYVKRDDSYVIILLMATGLHSDIPGFILYIGSLYIFFC